MKIAVIGTGYVGLVAGVCFADHSFKVLCIDKNPQIVATLKKGIPTIYEDQLAEYIKRNQSNGNLEFSDNIAEVAGYDVIILAVGTPTSEHTGAAEMRYLYMALEEMAPHLKDEVVLIIKSTVPVGTALQVEQKLHALRSNLQFDIISNPEFLREGRAIDDFVNPDRVVIGAKTQRAKDIAQQLYQGFTIKVGEVFFTDNATAELIKYASNAFLATKVAFINEIADLSEKCGADIEHISQAMGMDHRINPHFLNPGPGYGGSCFPKDTLALTHIAQQYEVPLKIVETVIATNDIRKKCLINKIKLALDGQLENRKVAIWGLAFKAGTDDMRDSPAIDLVNSLIAEQAVINVYDPQAMHEAKKIFDDKVNYATDALHAIKAAEVLVIMTEWDEFKNIDLAVIKEHMHESNAIVIDYRNIFTLTDARKNNISYLAVGKLPYYSIK